MNVGTLVITIHGAKNLPRTDLIGTNAYIKIKLDNQRSFKTTSKHMTSNPMFNETFSFVLTSNDVSNDQVDQRNFFIQVLAPEKDSLIAHTRIRLKTILNNTINNKNIKKKEYDLILAENSLEIVKNQNDEETIDLSCTVCLSFQWNPETVSASVAGKNTSPSKKKEKKETNVVESKKDTDITNVPKVSQKKIRPEYLRLLSYYNFGKKTYNYTTSFRLCSPIARFIEKNTNAILNKVGYFDSLKSTDNINNKIVPLLQTFDEKIDENISYAITYLMNGQIYIINKKDGAIHNISSTTKNTVNYVQNVVVAANQKIVNVTKSTVDTARSMTSATTNQIYNVTETTWNSVQNTKNSTIDAVSNVTMKSYNNLTNTAFYILQFIPIVGKKVMA